MPLEMRGIHSNGMETNPRRCARVIDKCHVYTFFINRRFVSNTLSVRRLLSFGDTRRRRRYTHACHHKSLAITSYTIHSARMNSCITAHI